MCFTTVKAGHYGSAAAEEYPHGAKVTHCAVLIVSIVQSNDNVVCALDQM